MESIWKSRKFILGLAIFVFSTILANVAKLIFFLWHLEDYRYRVLGTALYILSWPIGILGAIIAGRESIDYIVKKTKRQACESYRKTRETAHKGYLKTVGLPARAGKKIRHVYKHKIAKRD